MAEHTRTTFCNRLIRRIVLPTAVFASKATSNLSSTTSTTTSSTSTTEPSSSSGLSSAAIGGIAGGIVGGFVLAGAILGFLFYRRPKTNSSYAPPAIEQIDFNNSEYVGKPEPENAPNQSPYREDLEPVSGRTNLVY